MPNTKHETHTFESLFYNSERCHICDLPKSHELHAEPPKKIGEVYSTRHIKVRLVNPGMAQVIIAANQDNRYLAGKYLLRKELKELQAEVEKILEQMDWD